MGLFDVLSTVTGRGGADEPEDASDDGEESTAATPAELSPEQFRDRAEALTERSDVPELDFSEGALADLDTIATGSHPVDDPVTYGSYLGETLVREYDGEWVRDDGWAVRVTFADDDTTVAVFDAARMAIERGPVFEQVADRLHAQGDPYATPAAPTNGDAGGATDGSDDPVEPSDADTEVPDAEAARPESDGDDDAADGSTDSAGGTATPAGTEPATAAEPTPTDDPTVDERADDEPPAASSTAEADEEDHASEDDADAVGEGEDSPLRTSASAADGIDSDDASSVSADGEDVADADGDDGDAEDGEGDAPDADVVDARASKLGVGSKETTESDLASAEDDEGAASEPDAGTDDGDDDVPPEADDGATASRPRTGSTDDGADERASEGAALQDASDGPITEPDDPEVSDGNDSPSVEGDDGTAVATTAAGAVETGGDADSEFGAASDGEASVAIEEGDESDGSRDPSEADAEAGNGGGADDGSGGGADGGSGGGADGGNDDEREAAPAPSRSAYEAAAIEFTNDWPAEPFDYSPASLSRLDDFLEDQWDGRFRPESLDDSPTDPEAGGGPLVEVGAYVGEVLVREYDGEWVRGDDGEAAVAVAGRHGRREVFPVFEATRTSLVERARIAYEVDALANRIDVDRTASGAEQTGFALGEGGPGTAASSADVITTLVDRADAFVAAWPGYDLNYRPASLVRLDNLVAEELDVEAFQAANLGDWTDPDALRLADHAAGASAYFAAVLVRHLGAQWEIGEAVALSIEGPAGETRVRPFDVGVACLRREAAFMRRYDRIEERVTDTDHGPE